MSEYFCSKLQPYLPTSHLLTSSHSTQHTPDTTPQNCVAHSTQHSTQHTAQHTAHSRAHSSKQHTADRSLCDLIWDLFLFTASHPSCQSTLSGGCDNSTSQSKAPSDLVSTGQLIVSTERYHSRVHRSNLRSKSRQPEISPM